MKQKVSISLREPLQCHALCSFVVFVCLFALSCTRIPADAIKLNQIVRTNLEDLHKKHVAIAHAYFTLKREQFDDWFVSKYQPIYLENYRRIWNQEFPNNAFELNDPEHHRQYMQDSIAEYEELVTGWEALEKELVDSLDQGYSDLVRANEAVTDLLQSAKALTDAQKEFYNQTIGQLIPPLDAERIDQKIKDLQEKANRALGGS